MSSREDMAVGIWDTMCAEETRKAKEDLAQVQREFYRYYKTLSRVLGRRLHEELARTDKFAAASEKAVRTQRAKRSKPVFINIKETQ